MNKKRLTIFFSLISVIFLTSFNRATPISKAPTINENPFPVTLHFFYSESCSSCSALEKFLIGIKKDRDNVAIEKYSTDNDTNNPNYTQNVELLLNASEILINKKTNEVPFLALGGKGFLGHNKTVEYEINYFVEKYSHTEQVDVVNKLING